MPDYQEMYYTMMRASEKAIRILIEAQQKCEELAISEGESQGRTTENAEKETG